MDHTTGVYPQAASGMPFSTAILQVTGDTLADLYEDLAAEQKARLSYDNILRLIDDPDVRDPIKFLREREVVHFQRFGDALRITQDNLDPRNFYAFNPSFDTKCNPVERPVCPVAPISSVERPIGAACPDMVVKPACGCKPAEIEADCGCGCKPMPVAPDCGCGCAPSCGCKPMPVSPDCGCGCAPSCGCKPMPVAPDCACGCAPSCGCKPMPVAPDCGCGCAPTPYAKRSKRGNCGCG